MPVLGIACPAPQLYPACHLSYCRVRYHSSWAAVPVDGERFDETCMSAGHGCRLFSGMTVPTSRLLDQVN